jgi:hypothetical protein
MFGSVAKQPPHLAIYSGTTVVRAAFRHHHIGHGLHDLREEINRHRERIAETGSVACYEGSGADPVDRLQAVG